MAWIDLAAKNSFPPTESLLLASMEPSDTNSCLFQTSSPYRLPSSPHNATSNVYAQTPVSAIRSGGELAHRSPLNESFPLEQSPRKDDSRLPSSPLSPRAPSTRRPIHSSQGLLLSNLSPLELSMHSGLPSPHGQTHATQHNHQHPYQDAAQPQARPPAQPTALLGSLAESNVAFTYDSSPYEFLTSPKLLTPSAPEYDAFPLDDSPLSEFLTTPVIRDDQDIPMVTFAAGEYINMDGFPYTGNAPSHPEEIKTISSHQMQLLSPLSPLMDSFESPFSVSSSLPQEEETLPITRSRPQPTGTRKSITPSSLIPLDAPTQPRHYRSPSLTSRKELPSTRRRRSTRGQVISFHDDQEDELLLEELPPNPTEKQKVEFKRRQNTIAARKSRKRKLEHQLELEKAVMSLKKEVRVWKVRSQVLLGVMRDRGIVVPEMDFESEIGGDGEEGMNE